MISSFKITSEAKLKQPDPKLEYEKRLEHLQIENKKPPMHLKNENVESSKVNNEPHPRRSMVQKFDPIIMTHKHLDTLVLLTSEPMPSLPSSTEQISQSQSSLFPDQIDDTSVEPIQ